jgi:hypothetical protein
MTDRAGDPRERELKFDLGDEAAARRLEAVLPPALGGRRQVNRFFDTPAGELRRRCLALRLRGEWDLGPPHAGLSPDHPGPPDRAILSLKGPRAGEGAFHDRPELQVELPPAAWGWRELDASALPVAWRSRLPELRAPLLETARFANVRRAHPLTPRWRAEVDRTEFGDGRRAWELEVEIGAADDPEAARRLVLDLLEKAGVPPRPQTRSKLERALRIGE